VTGLLAHDPDMYVEPFEVSVLFGVVGVVKSMLTEELTTLELPASSTTLN